jgi:hypothetical protein
MPAASVCLTHRFAELARIFRTDAANPADILRSFQRSYFDTALSSGSAAVPSLKAFAGSGRILFGSDFPYARVAGFAVQVQRNFPSLLEFVMRAGVEFAKQGGSRRHSTPGSLIRMNNPALGPRIRSIRAFDRGVARCRTFAVGF